MKKQLMIFDFVCFGIGAIFLTFVAILQNCGAFVYSDIT